ncbi:hypothetical protein [Bacillus sp. CHD6a]|uniref:hypothetical protein n=1 Tax=Bacillus sp. CHD6a TaxID=1643452 RepID=UPI0006CD642D|nr:hypothetical protein [Bacillus sp. CHD6a]KPB03556.1 hypothetical protein AAV98_16665 [Bacillus sp. CHD6a]
MGVVYVEGSYEGCGCFRCSTRKPCSSRRNDNCNSNSTIRSLEERIERLEAIVARNTQQIAENNRSSEARFASLEASVESNTERIVALENGDLTPAEVRAFFEANEGRVVTIGTTFGTVRGRISVAGTDVGEILTAEGDVVITPYRSVETV